MLLSNYGGDMKKYIVAIIVILCTFSCVQTTKAQEFKVPSSDYYVSDSDVTNFPYSSVVYTSSTYASGAGSSRASGVVIGRDYVLTAAHVMNGKSAMDVKPALESNKAEPFGHWSVDMVKSHMSEHYTSGRSYHDYAILKINPRKNADGTETHIGDVVKPLTVMTNAKNKSYFKGDDLALMGYPTFSKFTQHFSNFKITNMDDDYRLIGDVKSSGGMSGGPLLNNAAQVLGTYHGGGHVSTMIDAKVDNSILPWGLDQETSRIYVCADEAEWELKRKLIKPEGNYIEKMNGEKLTPEELDKLRNMKKGYQILSLSDGIVDYQLIDGLKMYIGGLTLYPTKATPNRYELVFSENEGEGQMTNLALTYDTEKKLSPNLFKRAGYTFTGWNTQADGSGEGYVAGAVVKNFTSENNGKVTLYAQWAPNQETASVSYIDDTLDQVITTDSLTGNYGTADTYRTQPLISAYLAKGYKLISDNYPDTGVIYNQAGVHQEFQVHLTHDSTTELETKTVSRRIHYTYSDGSKALEDDVAKLRFKRNVVTDKVSGDKSYGDWIAEGETQFNRVETPTISGFIADRQFIPLKSDITANTKDIELTVVYSAEAKKPETPPSSEGGATPPQVKDNKKLQDKGNKKAAAKHLPETREINSYNLSMIGISLIGLMMLVLLKKKEN